MPWLLGSTEDARRLGWEALNRYRPDKVRQAVVIVHGMGEQRPLETLKQFIKVAIAPVPGVRDFYSRPDLVGDSFESRVYLAPPAPEGSDCEGCGRPEARLQTEFYEYHWAHLMQGNRIDDLWPVFRRMMLRLPHRVPSSLRAVWLLAWGILVTATGLLIEADFAFTGTNWFEDAVVLILGGGAVGAVVAYALARLGPGWITSSFVDVVRYLDTSPRSYQVRRDIREGMVDLLERLHDVGRYQRIVVVAHSLGAFIAYDGISYLWSRQNVRNRPDGPGPSKPDGLDELEDIASDLPNEAWSESWNGSKMPRVPEADVVAYQRAQRRLWRGLRAQGNSWLISDFITFGTPMYFADRLATKNLEQFKERVGRSELATCPPQPEGDERNNARDTERWFSWSDDGHRVLYYGAPFAVVRWTNLWFPARFGFFGDWFGHRLAPLFGNGIRDIPIRGNLPWRWIPGYAHAQYFAFPGTTGTGSATAWLRKVLDLGGGGWLGTADSGSADGSRPAGRNPVTERRGTRG